MKLYKVLSADGRSCHGGDHEWSLPRGKRPGKWTKKIKPIPCEQGWHACRGGAQLLKWLGESIWECEVRGEVIDHDYKIVAEQIRIVSPTSWSESAARLFAADCAARVAHLSGDPRTYEAIDVARRYVIGISTRDELYAAQAAAWDAARDAARAAARDAARDAARAVAWDAARDAAWDAARDAARAAARDAARAGAAAAAAAGAWDAARKWQAQRLLRYVHGLPCRPIKYKDDPRK